MADWFDALVSAATGWLISPAQAGELYPRVAASEPEVVAFYVNWDAASRASLRENLSHIDVLVPEWLHLADASGELSIDDPERIAQVSELVAPASGKMKVLPLVNNYSAGTWQVEWLAQILADEDGRERLISGLLAFVEDNEFAGITIGLQGIRAGESEQFLDFAASLYGAFHAEGLLVYHTLAMQDRAVDAVRLSHAADAIIVLGDGEDWPRTEPGPLASQAWFENGIQLRATEIPHDKLILTVANMARDWSDGGTETYSVQEAFSRTREAVGQITMHPGTLNPTTEYVDADGRTHTIWMLDAVTAFNQWQAARRLRPRGLALWRLGTEDPSIWGMLKDPEHANADGLLEIAFSHQIDRYGTGEVTRLTGLPQNGQRQIEISPEGRILAQSIRSFPRSFEVMQWGADDPHLLALTFDDGPDPEFTPLILDVLKEHGVTATFFMVGNQMLRHPDIVQRVLAEGHEIGSHTYSHVNISRAADQLLRLELNATQRVFESITGRNLVLFRAPYARDTNPESVDEIRPLATISELGYLAVNMNIDSRDWYLPTRERILKASLAGIRARAGNIVLLHDGGGKRGHTVAALPEIIQGARAEGFEFVGVSRLIGKSRDEIHPLTETQPSLSLVQATGFGVIREVSRLLGFAFGAAVALGICRSLLLIVLSFLRRKRRRATSFLETLVPGPAQPSVGVVVPGYNEEKVIVQTVRSLLASTLPDIKILVVDDGSTDDTYELCRRTFKAEKRVKVITKKNGGKSAALNVGFKRLRTDIIIAMDADTIFLPDAIELLIAPFTNPKVAAVSGNAKVGNRVNLLTKWQALEYITAQNLDRRAFERLNCIAVVPGAIGAWRRKLVIAAGGFTTDTLAEDADLTIKLLRQGYTVAYEESAIALTEAPETVQQFNKQRFRWMYGTLQVAFKHMGALALRDSKSVGLVTLPNTLLFQIVFPLLAPLADIGAIFAMAGLGWDYISNSTSLPVGEALLFLAVFFAFVLVDLLAAVTSFWHERKENWWLLLWLIPQRFFYRQLLYVVAIRAVLSAMRGSTVGWGTLTRTANVTTSTRATNTTQRSTGQHAKA